ncbi:MAG TPA: hypothetical protein VME66_03965 [Candidatus Acidoferrales bacterium]|nr:hypothetical protein [Candidatus Acidoferrales bacterium]
MKRPARKTRRWARLGSAVLAAVVVSTSTIAVDADALVPNVATAPAPQVAGGALTLDAMQHQAPGDGASLVALSGCVLDADGKIVRGDVDVMLTTTLGTFIGSDDSTAPGFHVIAKDGIFQAVLQAPVHAGTATVTAHAGKLQAQTTIVFTTSLHHGIAAGAFDLHIGAASTDYYSPLDTFLSDDSSVWNYETSGFVQGPISGGRDGDQAQLTVAFDNQNPINGECSGLTPIYGSTQLQTACQPRYEIYGDESTQTNLANSSDNLYFRIEKNADFAEWGDYDTSEFSDLGQTYAATALELHGAKANYDFGKLSVTGLYATDVEAFQRDIIAPNGTSGTYYLSRQLVVPGSEIVQLELQPLNRPGDVVSETVLTGGVDYELDPETGALTFTEPVSQTSIDPLTGAPLAQYIIVTYQYDGGTGSDALGARLQYALPGTPAAPSGVGVSNFSQNMGAASYSLTSADVALAQGSSRFMAEVANAAQLNADGTSSDGKAYHVEEQISNSHLKADVYVRHADPGFVNDASATSFVSGQTQYGASVSGSLSKRTAVSLQVQEEHDQGTSPLVLSDPSQYLDPGSAPAPGNAIDSDLSTVSGSVVQKVGHATATLGLSANDYTDDLQSSLNTNNMQAIARIAVPLAPRWSALAEVDQTLSGASTELYPQRQAVGVAYQVANGIQVGATTQALQGGTFGTRHFTSLDTMIDRQLDGATELTAKYAIYGGANGFTAQQEIGLNDHLEIARHVRADLGFEDATGSLFNLTGAGLQFAQPYAVGSSTAGLALTGGTDYHVGAELVGDPDFKAGARFEHSNSLYGSENVIHLTAAGSLNDSDKLLVSFDRSAAANQLLGYMPAASDLDMGFALRDPRSDAHNWLISYEFRQYPGLLPSQVLTPGQTLQQNDLLSSGSVVTEDGTLALEGIESVTPRLELYGKIASRNSQSEISPGVFSSSTIEFLQTRARYEIGQRYDATLEAREILQNIGDFHETGYIGEFGYLLTPELRAAVGYEGGWIDQMIFDQGQSHKGAYVDLTMRVQNLWRH